MSVIGNYKQYLFDSSFLYASDKLTVHVSFYINYNECLSFTAYIFVFSNFHFECLIVCSLFVWFYYYVYEGLSITVMRVCCIKPLFSFLLLRYWVLVIYGLLILGHAASIYCLLICYEWINGVYSLFVVYWFVLLFIYYHHAFTFATVGNGPFLWAVYLFYSCMILGPQQTIVSFLFFSRFCLGVACCLFGCFTCGAFWCPDLLYDK